MRWPHRFVLFLLLGLVGWGATLFALGVEEYLLQEGQSALSRFSFLFSPGDWFVLFVFHELQRGGTPFSVLHPALPSEPYWEIEVTFTSAKERDSFLGRLEIFLAPFRPFGLSERKKESVYELFWGNTLWFRFRFHLKEIPKVAVVIDDIGYNPRIAERFFSLPVKLNVAVFPHAPYSIALARRAAQQGKEVLIHLPMEALSPGENSGERFLLRVGMAEEEIARLIGEAFERIPEARGVNNHKGSKATQDRRLMELCAAHFRKKGVYFLDSLTTPHSLAFQVMREMGVPALRRDVFLDGETDVGYVLRKLHEALAIAQRRGFAVAIGHPKEATYEALRKFLSESHSACEFVFLSEILGERGRE